MADLAGSGPTAENPANPLTSRYRSELLGRDEHRFEQQLWLKRRVRDTYADLLHMVAGVPLGGGALLDTGSASGAFEAACRESGFDCVSLDIDMGVDFERDAFPFDDAAFRFVNSNSVIEHLHDPSLYLAEVHRVLEPGGYLFMVTPHWPYCWKDFYDSYTHFQPYSHVSLRRVLTAHGFEPLALVPWLVKKSRLFWRLPAPWSFRVAKYLLLFPGTARNVPGFLKGHSTTLLALARKPERR